MHFHLPKPLHGWRAFVGEVGIIVLGVLIALSAEQAVQSWEWRRQADEARSALRAELGEDNLPQAYARLAVDTCLQNQLTRLQAALDQHIGRSEFASLANTYSPPDRTWDDATWKSVGSSGVLSHSGPGELVRWSLPYSLIVTLAPISAAEREDISNLRAISGAPGQLTALERDRVEVALQHLRARAKASAIFSEALAEASREAGVTLSREQQQEALRQVRDEYGNCVVVPRIRRFSLTSQANSISRRKSPASGPKKSGRAPPTGLRQLLRQSS